MSKKLFRYLRGELNGFYLTSLHSLMNVVTETAQKFLANFKEMQFELDEDLIIPDEFIPFNVMKGIGIIAGAFVPYVDQDSNIASIKFSRTHIVNGEEYSERGLFNKETESFSFYTGETTDDINDLASANLRSSMIEQGAKPIGYIPEGVVLLNEDGTIDKTKIVLFTDPDNYAAELPDDKAYSLYYGDRYLYLAEKTPIVAKLPNAVYIELVKQLQWIRYNGTSIESICHLASLICPDYLYIFPDFTWHYRYAIIRYGIDEGYEADDKIMYANIFKLIIGMKFPQLSFSEVPIEVTRDSEGNVTEVKDLSENQGD